MQHDSLSAALESKADAMLLWRSRFSDRPEKAHQEHRTAAMVESILGAPEARFGATGLLYRVGGDIRGVVVRAELDALPVVAVGRSILRHACGHDVHLAALCGLVLAAREHQDRLPRPLWAVFQPSEEAYPSGAEQLATTGLINDAHAVVGCHVHPGIEWGQLALTPGTVNAACDNLTITVIGTGGHAAYPHESADPVLALCQVIVALHAALPRSVDPTHPISLGVGVLQAGSGPSAIPGEARAEATLRTFVAADRVPLNARVRTIVEATARAHGCRGVVELHAGEPALINSPELTVEARRRASAAGWQPVSDFTSCGADDFAYLSSRWPGVMAFLGTRGAPGDAGVSLHHPAFRAPDAAIAPVSRALALLFDSAASTPEGRTA